MSHATGAPPLAALGRVRVHYAATPSTMDAARALARGDFPHGVVVTATVQTAGRGRFGRRWEAPAGTALLCTTLLRPALAASRAPLLSVAAALATAAAVEEITRRPATLKWPNDVLIASDRGLGKVAGILVETSLDGDRIATAAVGIGINISAHPPALPATTDLAEVAGRPIDRAAALAALLRQLATALARLEDDASGLLAAFRARLVMLGQTISVTDATTTYAAIAEDIDSDGALLVRTAGGEQRRLLAGDITLRA
ncbi:MAG: biotin--[acetyl-CoA-carboxylase] ligase [Chloroflexi bacterium]|nr:biotin--[acetyl-CoA-carboxylase] ligase [Chloroflexota bacterium]